MAGPDIRTMVDDPSLYQRVDVEILCRKRDNIISTLRISNFAAPWIWNNWLESWQSGSESVKELQNRQGKIWRVVLSAAIFNLLCCKKLYRLDSTLVTRSLLTQSRLCCLKKYVLDVYDYWLSKQAVEHRSGA
jgi:hypothetical protein